MQSAFAFPHRPNYGSLEFLDAAANAAARAALGADWPDGRLALWGEAGCGKTHLLHLWAARQGTPVTDGPALTVPEHPPALPLVIDRADEAPPLALLHHLNAAQECGARVLLAARDPPARWSTVLPDLASRLRATFAVRIDPADDALLRMLMTRLFLDRQLRVSPVMQEWLLRRLPRTPGAIRAAVERLDRAGLEAGRPVTRALAWALVDLLPGDGEEPADDDISSHPPAVASSAGGLPG